MALPLPLVLAALTATTVVTAQAAPAPGLRYFGALDSTDTFILDSAGNTMHTWPSSSFPGVGIDLAPDGTLFRAINYFPTITIGGAGGAVQRVAFDGTVLWQYNCTGVGFTSHHDVEVLPNGNVLLIVWEEKTGAEAIAAGRDPALLPNGIFRPDYIIEVQQTGPNTGQIVWEWHAWDHLIQDFDSAQANFGPVTSHPELVDINYPPVATQDLDWMHANGFDYDPFHDWIVLSARHQNELWIIDHGTTTAEAAGHTGGRWGKGGDILYRWGNPEAYRAGTVADKQLGLQHDPRFIPPGSPGAGNVTVFNNNYTATQSAAQEIVLPTDPSGNFVLDPSGRYGPTAPVWQYASPAFHSTFISSAERLPNGNTLICSGAQHWVFEVTSAGQIVWSQILPGSGSLVFHAHYTDRCLWSSAPTVSAPLGGTVDFDLMAGTPQAGNAYFLLGSISGVSPGIPFFGSTLPLNLDGFLLLTIQAANSGIFVDNLGFVGPAGTVRSSFVLPPAVLPSGLQMHYAAAMLDNVSGLPVKMSNPVELRLGQ